MAQDAAGRISKQSPHPYLAGNFAPVYTTHPLTPCTYTGEIPASLAGGQYIRNGSNPLLNDEQDRMYHWFDGDGMLAGVLFRKVEGGIQPQFVNSWVETDILKANRKLGASGSKMLGWPWRITRPIPPSISTLVDPTAGPSAVGKEILRTVLIRFVSHLPWSKAKIRRISVANTAMLYHDGRALATCEAGPPIRVGLPGLETIGWFNGAFAEGEESRKHDNGLPQFAGSLQITTAHPKVDEETGEMILFHNISNAPYVRYSVLPSLETLTANPRRITEAPVLGMSTSRLMHDFGVSKRHTVILNIPLSVTPSNLARGKPMVQYNPREPSRFGVLPRHDPDKIVWFEDDPCIITHTASTWDEYDADGNSTAVCMLLCRLIAPDIIYQAGNLEPPPILSTHEHWRPPGTGHGDGSETSDGSSSRTEESHICRLHYYRFPLNSGNSPRRPSHSFPLSAVDMEFPTVAPGKSMQNARFVYGCSSRSTQVNSADGSLVKIDIITKMHAGELVRRGRESSPRTRRPVDTRLVGDVSLTDGNDNSHVQLFALPPGIYAGEPRFVPDGGANEDRGHLLFFTFDEEQLLPTGDAPRGAASELWILDATEMKDVVAKIQLVQRVPYGLHGEWFTEEQIRGQRSRASKHI
ncbi:retinal pigment epithelial membrane protein [Eremomyces bilateralis CBS 781.70]|uniref:Retinal pigment epithelial membrane protein n=1 Tax=Eremomyces bilateralis CBS 781.70 TaxID=1392243 RepID=A0A6G1FTB0_9PEZI|nr:retinal pigment epithelial membrane protein [Eremomyces bilateralis CBS 781.70]KAF1808909.1 retinal pigment epithelial membrane protein [Eremomyces bilateralis CBS 781.70]